MDVAIKKFAYALSLTLSCSVIASPITLAVEATSQYPLSYRVEPFAIDTGLLLPGEKYSLSDSEYSMVLGKLFMPFVYDPDGGKWFMSCSGIDVKESFALSYSAGMKSGRRYCDVIVSDN